MKLKEYQGKDILKKNGINVQEGFIVTDISQIEDKLNFLNAAEYVVKAQIAAGGRGKAGGVKFADRASLMGISNSLLGKEVKGIKVNEILIAEKLDFLREFYLSITINRAEKCLTLILSL